MIDAGASNSLNSLGSLRVANKIVQHVMVAHTVQKKSCTIEARQRQFLTGKQISKIMKKNEPMYLAIIRPKSVQNERGLTQKVKRDQIKQTGPVRKAPPIVETRKRICSDTLVMYKRSYTHYWRSSRICFQNNSQRAGLQTGRSNLRLKWRKGLFRRTSLLIASVPRSTMSCKLRLTTYSLRDISTFRRALMEPRFFLCQRRMGAGVCVLITTP